MNPVLLRSTAISINRIMFLCESALRILISRREVIGNFFFVKKSENTSLATDRPPAKAKKNKKPPHKKNLIANHPTQRQHMRKRAGVITVGEQKAKGARGRKRLTPSSLALCIKIFFKATRALVDLCRALCTSLEEHPRHYYP